MEIELLYREQLNSRNRNIIFCVCFDLEYFNVSYSPFSTGEYLFFYFEFWRSSPFLLRILWIDSLEADPVDYLASG